MKSIIILFLTAVLFVCSCVNHNKSIDDKSSTSEAYILDTEEDESIEKDVDYYKSKSYRIFEDYKLAVNCPVKLQVNPNGNPNFTLHYSGLDDNRAKNKGAYYEVSIIDWSYHHSLEVIESKLHHEILPKLLRGSKKTTKLISGEERIVYTKSYRDGVNIGKTLAFIREGVIYIFNVIGNDDISRRFEDFASNINFYSSYKEAAGVEQSKEDIKEIIVEDILKTSDMMFHKSSEYKYSIKYPKDWVIMEDYNQMLVFVAADEFSTRNFNISIINNVKRNLEKLVEGNNNEMRQIFPDAKIIQEYKLKVNEMESIKTDIQATSIDESGQQFNSIYSFLQNKKLYIVNFGCDLKDADDYNDIIRKIISTFKITDLE